MEIQGGQLLKVGKPIPKKGGGEHPPDPSLK